MCEGLPLKYANQSGITITHKAADSPASNGQAERTMRPIKDCMRTKLSAAGLADKYWDQTAQECVFKCNLIPRNENTKSPHTLLFVIESEANPLPFGVEGSIPYRSLHKTLELYFADIYPL